MWHDEIVEISLARYQDQLQELQGGTPALVAARDAISDFNAAALQGLPLVQFACAHLQPLTSAERMLLVNQYSLGFGNPYGGGERPGLMIIGTEHAYDPAAAPHSLAIEGCALSALWRVQAQDDIAASVAGIPTWANVGAQFQCDPSAFYGPQPSGHTWMRAAHVLGVTTMTRMFQSAYLLELSAHAALVATDGHAIGQGRIDFLSDAFARCVVEDDAMGRSAIKTLWFHGATRKRTFVNARANAIRAFFGLGAAAPLPPLHTVVKDGRKILVWRSRDRVVLLTSALSGMSGATNAYWAVVRRLLTRRVYIAP